MLWKCLQQKVQWSVSLPAKKKEKNLTQNKHDEKREGEDIHVASVDIDLGTSRENERKDIFSGCLTRPHEGRHLLHVRHIHIHLCCVHQILQNK